MHLTSFVQLVAACIGIVGSLFFAIGVMRQNVEAMARLSGSYWDWNPHMPPALAAQKADYLFGGCLIVLAFVLQLASFFASPDSTVLTEPQARVAPWAAGATTVVLFLVLRAAAARVAKHYEVQISEWLKRRNAQHGT